MSETKLPLGDSDALLVLGSQNWNPADRWLGRDRIASLQILTVDGPSRVPALDGLGPNGLRDLVVLDGHRVLLTTGYELAELSLSSGALTPWPLGEDVSDVHEMGLDGDRLLLPNTAFNEGLEVSLTDRTVVRHGLSEFRHARSKAINHARPLGGAIPFGPKPVRDDHFHFNQLAADPTGSLLAVVHHVHGFRPVSHVAKRLVGHGDGGVIDLGRRTAHDLGLRAPHSLRLVDGHAVILDSGRSEVVAFDERWRETTRWPTPGWGRGLAVHQGRWYVGVSATRRRYLEDGQDPGDNLVVCLDPATGAELGRWIVEDIEQVWSVRVIDRGIAEALAALPEAFSAG